MTRTFITATLILAGCAPALGIPARQRTGDTSKAVTQLMKLEGKWARAVVRRDAKALGRILADDYAGTGSDGTVRNKAQTLAELKAAAVPIESLTPYDIDVDINGDRATVNARATVMLRLEGRAVSRSFSYTRHYVRRKGKWNVLDSHTKEDGEQ